MEKKIRTKPDGRLIPVSKAERREVFLQEIGNDHPLMDLILKCINNHPQVRPHASEIVERLAGMVLQFPTSFANRLDDALGKIQTTKENRDLREENIELREKNRELRKENGAWREENDELREEIDHRHREILELRTENKLLKIKNKNAGVNLQDLSPSQVS